MMPSIPMETRPELKGLIRIFTFRFTRVKRRLRPCEPEWMEEATLTAIIDETLIAMESNIPGYN